MTKNTIGWFVVREKHCWMAGKFGYKLKRTRQSLHLHALSLTLHLILQIIHWPHMSVCPRIASTSTIEDFFTFANCDPLDHHPWNLLLQAHILVTHARLSLTTKIIYLTGLEVHVTKGWLDDWFERRWGHGQLDTGVVIVLLEGEP